MLKAIVRGIGDALGLEQTLADLPLQRLERLRRKLDNGAISYIANVKRTFSINGYAFGMVNRFRNRLKRIALI